VSILATPEPIRLNESVRIDAALEAMLAQDRVAVVVSTRTVGCAASPPTGTC
jgi:hypothetical protein